MKYTFGPAAVGVVNLPHPVAIAIVTAASLATVYIFFRRLEQQRRRSQIWGRTYVYGKGHVRQ